jgi:hypothetical protein
MYNKLFGKILDSSVWLESDSTRIVWLTLLASMDETGFCAFAAVGNVAGRARVSPKAAKVALDVLSQPDPNSFDPENEGKRIERVQGGWIVLNAQKYRAIQKRADMQEKTRERVRRFREKKRSGNANVTHRNDSVTPSEAYTEEKTERGSRPVKKQKNPSSSTGSVSPLPERAASWPLMLQQAMQPVGVTDLEGPTNMAVKCLEANPDVDRAEILDDIKLHSRTALKRKSRIINPSGYVLDAVPKSVAARTAQREKHRAESEAIKEQERPWDEFLPPAGDQARTIWESILSWIKGNCLLGQRFGDFLEQTRGVDLRGDTLYVKVPSEKHLDIHKQFVHEIAVAIEKGHPSVPVGRVQPVLHPDEITKASKNGSAQ